MLFVCIVSVSPAELAKKQQGEKMRREHMFALKHEGTIYMYNIHVFIHMVFNVHVHVILYRGHC